MFISKEDRCNYAAQPSECGEHHENSPKARHPRAKKFRDLTVHTKSEERKTWLLDPTAPDSKPGRYSGQGDVETGLALTALRVFRGRERFIKTVRDYHLQSIL